jgi:hypothetical protein
MKNLDLEGRTLILLAFRWGFIGVAVTANRSINYTPVNCCRTAYCMNGFMQNLVEHCVTFYSFFKHRRVLTLLTLSLNATLPKTPLELQKFAPIQRIHSLRCENSPHLKKLYLNLENLKSNLIEVD